jgi:drug/metabolite transporter (DMT)-like permease
MGTPTVYLLVMISAFFWGANFVLAGPVLADLPPLWAAALRFLLGAVLMFVIAGVRREDVFGPLRRHAGAYLLLGTVGITAFNLFFFFALQSTSASSAALIMATNPLLTTLLAAVFLGERPTTRHLLALPLALTGVAVVIAQGDMHRLLALRVAHGDLLMLAANVSWALYNVLGRRYMPPGSSVVNTTWVMAVGACVLVGIAFASGAHVAALDIKASLALAVMVVGGTVLAYLFWGMGIMRLGAARTAIFLNLVPVFAMLISTTLGAPPSAAQLAGGLLVLGGVSIAMLPRRRVALA